MSTDADTDPITVHILGKEYRIACTPEEENALVKSAGYVDQKMKEIRGRGKAIGTDRIAVMAALNIAHELLQNEEQSGSDSNPLGSRIKEIQQKIETALNDTRQIEI